MWCPLPRRHDVAKPEVETDDPPALGGGWHSQFVIWHSVWSVTEMGQLSLELIIESFFFFIIVS